MSNSNKAFDEDEKRKQGEAKLADTKAKEGPPPEKKQFPEGAGKAYVERQKAAMIAKGEQAVTFMNMLRDHMEPLAKEGKLSPNRDKHKAVSKVGDWIKKGKEKATQTLMKVGLYTLTEYSPVEGAKAKNVKKPSGTAKSILMELDEATATKIYPIDRVERIVGLATGKLNKLVFFDKIEIEKGTLKNQVTAGHQTYGILWAIVESKGNPAMLEKNLQQVQQVINAQQVQKREDKPKGP